MNEKNYDIIYKKIEELMEENKGQENEFNNSNIAKLEYDEISELCKLSLETREQSPCLFTTT